MDVPIFGMEERKGVGVILVQVADSCTVRIDEPCSPMPVVVELKLDGPDVADGVVGSDEGSAESLVGSIEAHVCSVVDIGRVGVCHAVPFVLGFNQ